MTCVVFYFGSERMMTCVVFLVLSQAVKGEYLNSGQRRQIGSGRMMSCVVFGLCHMLSKGE